MANSPTQTYPIPVTVTFKKKSPVMRSVILHRTSQLLNRPAIGLELWLDASDTSSVSHSSMVHSGTTKAERLSAEQATASKVTAIANGQNSLSTLRFDGVDDYISVPSLNITQSYSIFENYCRRERLFI